MNNSLLEILSCPYNCGRLKFFEDNLHCEAGHEFPVVDGVPVLLRDDVEQTLWVAEASLREARRFVAEKQPLAAIPFVETLGFVVSEEQLNNALHAAPDGEIDAAVQIMINATCGNLYVPLIGKLERYPIPTLEELPDGAGKLFLEIGCNWGRWCVAAARKNYRVIGVDPSLGSVLAARRVCRQLGVECEFVVADGRFLPFAPAAFDTIFSYSVLQHLSKPHVAEVLAEIARALKTDGESLVQISNRFGVKAFFNYARRGFTEGEGFDVRFWRPVELKKLFEAKIGRSSLFADAYFGLNCQKSDIDILPLKYRPIVRASEMLKSLSRRANSLANFADSLYVRSIRSHRTGEK